MIKFYLKQLEQINKMTEVRFKKKSIPANNISEFQPTNSINGQIIKTKTNKHYS
jgi:hypothetical protein